MKVGFLFLPLQVLKCLWVGSNKMYTVLLEWQGYIGFQFVRHGEFRYFRLSKANTIISNFDRTIFLQPTEMNGEKLKYFFNTELILVAEITSAEGPDWRKLSNNSSKQRNP